MPSSGPGRINLYVEAMPLAMERVSGIGHVLYGLVRHLLADSDFSARYQIVLIYPSSGAKYINRWGFGDVKHIRVPIHPRVWNRLAGLPFLPPFDLFFGRGVYLFLNFRVWPLRWSKSIATVHDLSFLLHPEMVAPLNRRFLASNIRRWIGRSSRVITASRSSMQEIHDHLGVPNDRLRLVQWGVDSSVFFPRPTSQVKKLAQRLQLPEHYILYLGNIEPRKNLVRLIAAYRALPKPLRARYPLVMVGGGGWLAEDINRAIGEAGAAGDRVIQVKGYVDDEDLPALYTGATMLAWPTLYEGFGVPPLQAMACGTPCVVSHTSSLPEVVGDAGLYVDPENVQDISDKMEMLLEDNHLRDQLIKLGYANAKALNWQATIRQLHTVIDELAS